MVDPTRPESPVRPGTVQMLGDMINQLGFGFDQPHVIDPEEIPVGEMDWLDIPTLLDAEKKVTIETPVHPVFLAIKWLYRAVCRKIHDWFYSTELQREKEILNFAHNMKNYGDISIARFGRVRRALKNKDELKRVTEDIVKEFVSEGFLDIRAKEIVKGLLDQGHIRRVWVYINTISVLNRISDNTGSLEGMIGAEEALVIKSKLDKCLETAEFSEELSDELQDLSSRIVVKTWVEGLDFKETRETTCLKSEVLRACDRRDHKGFKKVAVEFLEKLSKKCTRTEILKRYYYKELAKAIEQREDKEVFRSLSHMLMTQNYVDEWHDRFNTVVKTIDTHEVSADELEELKSNLKNLYRIYGKILEEDQEFYGSESAFSNTLGILRDEWTEISDKFENGDSHLFCSCIHADRKSETKPWKQVATTVVGVGKTEAATPSLADASKHLPSRLKIMIPTCSWGGGHKSAASAIQRYLPKEKYHTSVVDFPEEVLILEDILHQVIGEGYSIARLYNTLIAGGHFETLRWLSKIPSKVVEKGEVDETLKHYVMQRVMKERPHIIISSYQRHSGVFLSVAKDLGIPFLQISTDYELTEGYTPPTTYKHFKGVISSDLPKVVEQARKSLKPSQMVALGPIVRPEFLTEKTEEEINKFKEDNDIADKDKLVMYVNGALGTEAPWPTMIMEKIGSDELKDAKLVLICGRNRVLKEKYEQIKSTHPHGDRLIVRGFVGPEEMSNWMKVSKCLITKAGGSTVGEAASVGVRMLFDSRMDDAEYPWEAFNRDIMVDQGVATHFRGENEFFPALVKELETKDADFSIFKSKVPQTESLPKLIDEMIAGALTDKSARKRCDAWKNAVLQVQTPARSHNRKTFLSLRLSLQNNLQGIIDGTKFQFTEESLEAIALEKPVRFDFESTNIEKAVKYDEREVHLLLNKLSIACSKFLEKSSDFSKDYLPYFEMILVQYNRAFEKGMFRHFRNKRRLENELAKLDRYLLAAKLQAAGITHERFSETFELTTEEGSRAACKKISYLFKTKKAVKLYDKWVNHKLSRGRKKSSNEFVMNPLDASYSFALCPDQVDAVSGLFIHKHLSARNQHLELDPSKGIMVRVDEKMIPATELQGNFGFIENKIINLKTQKEHVYDHEKGLIKGSLEDWDALPVFKTKERKTKDYRLEVVTDVGSENHAWFRMKTPSGKVYSVGKFWKEGLPDTSFLATTAARLNGPDKHDYLGREMHQKVTKIPLDKKTFYKVKRYVEKKQKEFKKENIGYNVLNGNCVSFTKQVLKKIGVEAQTKIFLVELFLDLPLALRKFFYNHRIARWAANIIFAPFAIIRNLLIYALGGAEHVGEDGLKNDKIMRSWKDAFRIEKNMADHPKQLRLWQEMQTDYATK